MRTRFFLFCSTQPFFFCKFTDRNNISKDFIIFRIWHYMMMNVQISFLFSKFLCELTKFMIKTTLTDDCITFDIPQNMVNFAIISGIQQGSWFQHTGSISSDSVIYLIQNSIVWNINNSGILILFCFPFCLFILS